MLMKNPMDESKAHEMKKGDMMMDKKEMPHKVKRTMTSPKPKFKFKMNKKGVISKVK